MTTPIWIASFDIGKKNFAFCIEEVQIDDLSAITNIPLSQRYFKDGSCTPEFGNVLNQVCNVGKIILLENIDLTYDCDKTKYLDPTIFINMTSVLDKFKPYWDKCMSFVIEQQMGFGKQRNYMALKLGQHCFSYFIFQYADYKETIEFPAYYKTKVLGATKMSKYQRKAWAVEKAIQILSNRDEQEIIKQISSRKKRDDVADVVCQLQAYKYLLFLDNKTF
jgi:hypothetical protein